MLLEHEYERRESEQVVQQALDRLEPNQRAVVVLVELQNSACQEAAQILGVPIGTMKIGTTIQAQVIEKLFGPN